jgi:DnaJ-class molecular chaperone
MMSVWDDDHQPYGTAAPGTEADWKAAYEEVMSGEEAAGVLQDNPLAPHQILKISAEAGEAAIKRAFRKIVSKECRAAFENDAPQDVVDRFKEVKAAYSLMMEQVTGRTK